VLEVSDFLFGAFCEGIEIDRAGLSGNGDGSEKNSDFFHLLPLSVLCKTPAV